MPNVCQMLEITCLTDVWQTFKDNLSDIWNIKCLPNVCSQTFKIPNVFFWYICWLWNVWHKHWQIFRKYLGGISVGQTFRINVGQIFRIRVGQTFRISVGQTFRISVGQTFRISVEQTFKTSVGQMFDTMLIIVFFVKLLLATKSLNKH